LFENQKGEAVASPFVVLAFVRRDILVNLNVVGLAIFGDFFALDDFDVQVRSSFVLVGQFFDLFAVQVVETDCALDAFELTVLFQVSKDDSLCFGWCC